MSGTVVRLSAVAESAGLSESEMIALAASYPRTALGFFRVADGTHYAYSDEAKQWLRDLSRERARRPLRPKSH